MTFDELQKSWQAQQSGFKLKVEPDIFLKEVRRNKQYFEYLIFWRDTREVFAALIGVVLLLCFAIKFDLWSLYPVILLTLFVAVFLVIDRTIQKRNRPAVNDSLLACVECSFAQVEHQIWLLKNVLWWYLLPPDIGIAIFIGHVIWMLHANGKPFASQIVFLVFCAVLSWGVYWLNQYAVRKDLLPRKQELEQFLHSLKNAG